MKCETREAEYVNTVWWVCFPVSYFNLAGLMAKLLIFSASFRLHCCSVLSIYFIFSSLSIYILLCLLCHASAVCCLLQRCKAYIRFTVFHFVFKPVGHRNTHGWTLLAIASTDKIFTFSVYTARVDSRATGPTGGQGEICTCRPGVVCALTLLALTLLTQLTVLCYQYFWYRVERRATLSEEPVFGSILMFGDGRIENVWSLSIDG